MIKDFLNRITEECWVARPDRTHVDDVMQRNIDKLMLRYPDGFSAERSLHREDEA